MKFGIYYGGAGIALVIIVIWWCKCFCVLVLFMFVSVTKCFMRVSCLFQPNYIFCTTRTTTTTASLLSIYIRLFMITFVVTNEINTTLVLLLLLNGLSTPPILYISPLVLLPLYHKGKKILRYFHTFSQVLRKILGQ